MAGFGAVGQRFCHLLAEKERELRERYGLTVKLVGVCTKTQGVLIDESGIPLASLFDKNGKRLPFVTHPAYCPCETLEMIKAVSADAFLELTTLSIQDGEPASSYIAAALGLSKALASHHLQLLKRTGLVVSERIGQEIHYSLAETLEAKLLHQTIDAMFAITCPKC